MFTGHSTFTTVHNGLTLFSLTYKQPFKDVFLRRPFKIIIMYLKNELVVFYDNL